MKKIITFITFFIISALLTGCGSENNASKGSSKEANASTTVEADSESVSTEKHNYDDLEALLDIGDYDSAIMLIQDMKKADSAKDSASNDSSDNKLSEEDARLIASLVGTYSLDPRLGGRESARHISA